MPQSVEEQRKAVEQKVGAEAWAAANGLQAPTDLSADPALAEKLKPFAELTGREVAVLPALMQFNVPTINCLQLDKRPPASISNKDEQVVACEGGYAKNLLDVAKVLGTDVSDATAVRDQTSQWVVSLNFTGSGQEKWTALTREAFNNEGQACDASALGDEGKCRVAVVLDNEIISSPQIQGVLTGNSQITGNFDNAEAADLAAKLRYGALPVTFEQQEQQNVTATLGESHLRAGLLAAGIGMLLVIIYSFFYYRLLGSVIFASLVLSALLLFGALVVLGRQIGFTLTLAGIAGIIVSLGVAADSFVIYFERLKDEIREGRSPRSAVNRAWVRARRTIISANADHDPVGPHALHRLGRHGEGLRLRPRPGHRAGPGRGLPLPAPDDDHARPQPGIPVPAGQRSRPGPAGPVGAGPVPQPARRQGGLRWPLLRILWQAASTGARPASTSSAGARCGSPWPPFWW